ncbi:hypothetical protein HS088_TW13G00305 [Tripterygium wilfordii]|uniref:Uncharacterized protein n=1 Tax=Tripterygium wilfordii TaxID=458696 RepID=A0A7J7CTH9_TRIWF|nr:uncharacterized protein LOC120012960 [Tripterygium wilfordii]KAF5737425.1 hypothetical protein HS088_TW13G00305 [Tripterygium wilfordii]
MPRQNRTMEELLPGKIRKRGCSSPASSSSSIVQNYRFKRAILVGKRGGSTTPVPTWRLIGARTPSSALRAMESPKYAPSLSGSAKMKQAPVSARKLAATLWEMNGMPREDSEDRRSRREARARARERSGGRSVRSGSLPQHLSDPSHSPVSERMDRSGAGGRQRRVSSISDRLRLTDHSVGAPDSVSNASLMEIESRSRAQTPTGSTIGVKSRLKDASSALITSKELLKIINRMWGHEDRPSSSMPLISTLYAELERARLLINQLIQEQRSDHNEINYLMKRFAEEKAAWKNREQEVVEAAIESITGELDVERKLRRRFESLNKKLGKELAETKSYLLKAVKELENEKRARVVMEQVYDGLAGDIGDEKAEVQEVKRDSAKVCKEVQKEREMMQLADLLREERAQMQLSEAKCQLEEKNTVVDKLRSQLEDFLGTKRTKEKGRGSIYHLNDEDVAAYLSKVRSGNHQKEVYEEDEGEVDDGVECGEGSTESDLHSIELNMENNNKSYKWNYPLNTDLDVRKALVDEEELTGRRSVSGKGPRKSTSLQRSASDGVEWGIQTERVQSPGDAIDWGRFTEMEKQAQVKGYGDDVNGYKSARGLREHILSGNIIGSAGVYASPVRQRGQALPAREYGTAAQERPPTAPGTVFKSRLGEGQNARRSRW